MKNKSILAWHFLPQPQSPRHLPRTQYSEETVRVGKTLSLPRREEVELCESGYHASVQLTDAIYYGPSTLLTRVRVWGDLQWDSKKLVGRHRKCLQIVDAREVLIRFAEWCRDGLSSRRDYTEIPGHLLMNLVSGDAQLAWSFKHRTLAQQRRWLKRNIESLFKKKYLTR